MASPELPSLRERILGESPAMIRARDLLERFARSEVPIIVVGETGTGKELFAQETHRLSGRTGRLVDINCGAVPESLLESELFGHRRGAFTGAVTNRTGLAVHADDGTLFLDELASLSASGQVKLLRAVETGRVRGLGESIAKAVSFRLVAALQVPVDEALERGLLRPDLVQRLAGVIIDLPPLATRGDDVILIAHRLARDAGLVLTPNTAGALLEHPWPGNVRELSHAISRAGYLSDGGMVTRGLLEEAIGLGATPVRAPAAENGRATDRAALTALALRHAGNARSMARDLGVSRATVFRWAKELGLSLRRIARTGTLTNGGGR